MTKREQRLQAIAAEAAEWRHDLHRNPGTAFEETFASEFVSKKLTEWGIAHERGIAGTGVVATIEGQRNHSGRAIALRADMDALDIPEQSGQAWASQTPGKMHGCGHDGHTATLLAVAQYLNETRNFDGLIRLIFQPAEEIGRGAQRMLADGLLERFPFDEIYGYHNWPGLPVGTFAIRPGPMLASVDTFKIRLKGKGGHAAMPHATHDVIPAAAQLVLALQTLVSRETDPMAAAVLSVTNLTAGTGALNVIGDAAKLSGTVRTFNSAVRDHLEARMGAMTESVAATFGVQGEFEYTRILGPTINEPESTRHCEEVATAIVGADKVEELPAIMGGEDFGGFLEERPGAFIALGQSEPDANCPHNKGLHSPQYDFNDAILPIAANYFVELAERRLAID